MDELSLELTQPIFDALANREPKSALKPEERVSLVCKEILLGQQPPYTGPLFDGPLVEVSFSLWKQTGPLRKIEQVCRERGVSTRRYLSLLVAQGRHTQTLAHRYLYRALFWMELLHQREFELTKEAMMVGLGVEQKGELSKILKALGRERLFLKPAIKLFGIGKIGQLIDRSQKEIRAQLAAPLINESLELNTYEGRTCQKLSKYDVPLIKRGLSCLDAQKDFGFDRPGWTLERIAKLSQTCLGQHTTRAALSRYLKRHEFGFFQLASPSVLRTEMTSYAAAQKRAFYKMEYGRVWGEFREGKKVRELAHDASITYSGMRQRLLKAKLQERTRGHFEPMPHPYEVARAHASAWETTQGHRRPIRMGHSFLSERDYVLLLEVLKIYGLEAKQEERAQETQRVDAVWCFLREYFGVEYERLSTRKILLDKLYDPLSLESVRDELSTEKINEASAVFGGILAGLT